MNQAFDIAFAIAPDALIQSVILGPLGLMDVGPFTSVGREVSARQAWTSHYLQPDGLFVSTSSAVGVEMKTGSSTSLGQTLKYLVLLAMEEAATGRKTGLGLLYLVGENAVEKTRAQAGISAGGQVSVDLDGLRRGKTGVAVQTYVTAHEAAVEDVRRRVKVAVLSWRQFDAALGAAVEALAGTDAGGQTLRRLVAGLRVQIQWHTNEGALNWPLPSL